MLGRQNISFPLTMAMAVSMAVHELISDEHLRKVHACIIYHIAKKFCQFSHLPSISLQKSVLLFSCIYDSMEDTLPFTILMEINSVKYSHNTKVATCSIGEILLS